MSVVGGEGRALWRRVFPCPLSVPYPLFKGQALACIAELVAAGNGVDQRDEAGNTILHAAVARYLEDSDYGPVVEYLLQQLQIRPQMRQQGPFGWTPLRLLLPDKAKFQTILPYLCPEDVNVLSTCNVPLLHEVLSALTPKSTLGPSSVQCNWPELIFSTRARGVTRKKCSEFGWIRLA